MSFSQRLLWCGSSFLFLGMLLPITTSAQSVTADGTLTTTVTSPDNLNFTITNGNQPNSGANLFHSFSQFSVPTGGSATFNLVNTPNISTVFSRVTGGSVSNIDGLIQTTNNSNPVSLFLLNPSGIIFGPNASLNIGGSFVGTTANSIKFADGAEFSAITPQASPLLTIASPIGLNMGSNAGTITVQGQGNKLFDVTGFGTPSNINTPIGLQISANNTLALIGGAVNFSGGVVTTNGGGHLEVGSASNGQVELKPTSTGWVGDYSSVPQFNDIHLAKESLLDASGSNGSIRLQGGNISLTEGSSLLLQNLGTQPSGGITVNATGSLNLAGNTANGDLGSFMQIQNFGTGRTGDIAISAAQLSLQDGARILTRTRTQTAGGNITANVSGSTEVIGFNSNNPAIYTALTTFSADSGNAGNIMLSTRILRVLDSGQIISVALRSGDTGTIQVKATDQIEIAGFNPLAFSESSLTTFTQGSGNANSLVINTSRLVLQGGASLGSSTVATGSAGSVEINASKSIEIQGRGTEGNAAGVISRITSNAELLSPETQAAFILPAIPTGNAGSLTINTPSLRIADGAAVSVKNDGPGLAGNIQINANSLFLDGKSSIVASTASGNGGDIRLNLQSNLLMRHNSLISATAAGNGNGGNLTINSPVIVGIENSDIIANAVRGAGGNINITTQGLFGLKFRPQLTSENDITASSQFGLSGTVNISNLAFTPTAGLIELPSNIDDPSQRIVQGCRTYGNSRFVATGRGGLPEDPSNRRNSSHPWTDLRDPSAFRNPNALATVKQSEKQSENAKTPIVEATGWQLNAKGEVNIYAANNVARETTVNDCAGFLAIASKAF